MQHTFEIRAPNGDVRAEADSFDGARVGARCVLEEEEWPFVELYRDDDRRFARSTFRLVEGDLVEQR